MRHRGESMASIAQIGGCSEKIVRSYLKELRTAVRGSAPTAGTVRKHYLGRRMATVRKH